MSRPAVDRVLVGAQVVTPAGIVDADIGIAGETIAYLGTALEELPPSVERVDMRGLLVLPGAIDTHTHLRDPGFTHKEDIESGTRAAAAGGYTTVVGMPNVQPPTNSVERYQEALELYAQKALVDYNHNPAPTVLEEVPALAQAGALAFKIFMIEDSGREYPHMPGAGVHDHGRLLEIAEAVAATGLPLMVHPHDQELMSTIEQRFWARGERDAQAYAKAFAAYGGFVWDSATSFLIRLQEASGVRLHVLHVKTPRMVELLRIAKQRGLDVSGEMNPVSLFVCDDWANIERLGPYALSTWTGGGAASALWQGLRDGTIDVIGTDHAPHTREEKEIGWTDMWKCHGGTPQVQHVLPIFLTEAAKGYISVMQVADVTATRPAKRFGLFPRKGVIQVGSDADLVAIRTGVEDEIRESDVLSKCGWTPYEGWQVTARVEHTMVRGQFVVRSGRVVGHPGYGRHARPVASEGTPVRQKVEMQAAAHE